MNCEWCGAENVLQTHNDVYWELPDGTRAVQIKKTPCVKCPSCGMEYQTEETVEEIEVQLMLINLKQVPESLTFEELMKTPRHLKRNYFGFLR
ncbi:YokU family protein [Metabacillus fastidiosus]|uniref:YokU family protein n=1 Tax=Metabacillus fastidiosus TaxID=1458 RepID=UPI003D29DD5B